MSQPKKESETERILTGDFRTDMEMVRERIRDFFVANARVIGESMDLHKLLTVLERVDRSLAKKGKRVLVSDDFRRAIKAASRRWPRAGRPGRRRK